MVQGLSLMQGLFVWIGRFPLAFMQGGAPSPPATQGAQMPGQSAASSLLPMVMMGGLCFLVFYLLVIRPQRKQQQIHAAMLDGLKKNDVVRTSSGILGKVVAIEKERNVVVLKIDEQQNTRLRVLRSSIDGVIQEEKKSDEKVAAPEAPAAKPVPTK